MNANHRLCGSTDVELSELGVQQAKGATVDLLAAPDYSVVIVSDMQRAQRTAELSLGHTNFIVEPRLRERDWGELELEPLEKQPPYEDTPPKGESWEAFVSRVCEGLNSALAQHDMPLIVAHSGVYRVIRFLAEGTPYGERIANAKPFLVQPGENQWKISAIS
ncbi:fructose-2,6-bisphosphatase [Vibrio variabilis]|uniref:Fructose-2,6-bisphosphatase n=1 Tax=Vibrio variabilis TaxID=990271 RepID=A0ABQ0JHH6_9VIBR|nr:fructose-2,6-bisphosphatase [Vibrio variabilis]